MNITATGTSSLSSLYLQQLLGSSGTSQAQAASAGQDDQDSLSISSAAQQAAAGQDPFQTDLDTLEQAIASGDAKAARTAYQSMAEKMKQHGDLPSDFAAVGTALDSGDLASASTAVDKIKQHGSGQGNPPPPPPGGGTNPLKADLNQLGDLLESGDTTSAQTLFSKILDKLNANGTASTASSTSSSSGGSAVDDLTQALDSGDTTAASAAWKHLLEQMQNQQGPLAHSLASVAASAYTTAASAI